ncbi:MAG: tol-pal system protein YbgF [Pseudomonadota bacterium]
MFKYAIFIMMLFISTLAVAAQVDEKISDIENRISQIESTYLENSARTAAELSRVEAFQIDITEIRGDLQTNKHLINSESKEMGSRLTNIEQRLSTMEDRFDVFASQLYRALEKINPKIADEGKLYQSALDKVDKAQYLDAITTLKSFIKKYPKSDLTGSAQYWIAESYYSLRDWRRAIKEYQIFITKYPGNEKVSNAILKQGFAFTKLNLLDEAKLFLNKVLKDFPSSQDGAAAKEKLDVIENKQSQSKIEAKPAEPTSYPDKTLQQVRQETSAATKESDKKLLEMKKEDGIEEKSITEKKIETKNDDNSSVKEVKKEVEEEMF